MARFACEFIGTKAGGTKIKLQVTVEASDEYAALDAIKKQIPDYDAINYPSFKFGIAKRKMSALVRKTVKGAGPEEA